MHLCLGLLGETFQGVNAMQLSKANLCVLSDQYFIRTLFLFNIFQNNCRLLRIPSEIGRHGLDYLQRALKAIRYIRQRALCILQV